MKHRFFILFKNEVKLAISTSESFLSPAFFVFLIFLLFQMGESPALSWERGVFLSWMAPLLAGWLRMSRTFDLETDGGVMEGLRLIPGTAFLIILSKWLVNFAFILFLEAFSVALTILLFNLNHPFVFIKALSLPLILGAFGYSLLATFFAGLLMDHPRRDMILPVIGYPLLIPLVLGVIKCVSFGISGESFAWNADWLKILTGFNIIYLILVLIMWDTTTE